MADSAPKHFTPRLDSSVGDGLTREVAHFVLSTVLTAIPPDVVGLAKKSILDGFGLALAGSVAPSADIVQKYLKRLGGAGNGVIIGTDQKTAARFAAFANGVGIHADDFDDTQLAIAE